jgi:glycosyltransferase involved in cell wall biosynthesis
MPSVERQPAVSVIMPAYRVTEYIAEALSSVVAQTFQDFEIVVVNDGCPDTANLERALDPFRHRIRYLYQDNAGVAAARNAAVKAARAPLIAQLDPDDIWEPHYLEVQLAALGANPNADVVFPDMVFFGDTPWAGRTFMSYYPQEGEVTFLALVEQKCQVSYAVLARKDTLERVGLFDPDLRSAEDLDLWLRLVLNGGRIIYHRQALVRYRSRLGSLSRDTIAIIENRLTVLRKFLNHTGLTAAEKDLLTRTMERDSAEAALAKGKKAFAEGDTTAARLYLQLAQSKHPSWKLTAVLTLLRFAPPLARLAGRWKRW